VLVSRKVAGFELARGATDQRRSDAWRAKREFHSEHGAEDVVGMNYEDCTQSKGSDCGDLGIPSPICLMAEC